MSLWHWLTRSKDSVIPNWTEARALQAEKATYRYWGIKPETVFTWSRKFRPKARLKNVTSITERKRA